MARSKAALRIDPDDHEKAVVDMVRKAWPPHPRVWEQKFHRRPAAFRDFDRSEKLAAFVRMSRIGVPWTEVQRHLGWNQPQRVAATKELEGLGVEIEARKSGYLPPVFWEARLSELIKELGGVE